MASIKIKTNFASSVSSLVNIEDEGLPIVSTQDLNFVGAGVTVTENPLGTAEINIPAVSSLVNIEDEGLLIVSTQDLNFVGAGVTVTENPLGTAEINIPAVSSLVNIEDEGLLIVSTQDLNFVGAGVTVTENPLGTAEINIPGGSTLEIDNFTSTSNSGDTTNTTGLAFGAIYQKIIPAGKNIRIEAIGGYAYMFNSTTKYQTFQGFYFDFNGSVFLPNGFYFGDANSQPIAKVAVSSGRSVAAGLSGGTLQATPIAIATIKNTSLLDITLDFRTATKAAPTYEANWGSAVTIPIGITTLIF
jgi:hypothetical protein